MFFPMITHWNSFASSVFCWFVCFLLFISFQVIELISIPYGVEIIGFAYASIKLATEL